MSIGKKIIEIARAEIGVREETGKNDGVPSVRYMGGRTEPWCGHFVAWVYRQAGVPLPKDKPAKAGPSGHNPLASVEFLENTMKKAGRWVPPSEDPQMGDLVFFADRAGSDAGGGRFQRHVGIVESDGVGVVNTIEGNIANRVARRVHRRDDPRITGYGRHAAPATGAGPGSP